MSRSVNKICIVLYCIVRENENGLKVYKFIIHKIYLECNQSMPAKLKAIGFSTTRQGLMCIVACSDHAHFREVCIPCEAQSLVSAFTTVDPSY